MLRVINKDMVFVAVSFTVNILTYVASCRCYSCHRRTGNFLPGGGGEPFAQKFSQVAQIFTKQSKRNEGHMLH